MHLNLDVTFSKKVTKNDLPLTLTGDLTLTASADCEVVLGTKTAKLEAGKPATVAIEGVSVIEAKSGIADDASVTMSVQFTDAIGRLDPANEEKPAPSPQKPPKAEKPPTV